MTIASRGEAREPVPRMTSRRVADQLVAWRTANGYTQEQLAAEVGVTVGSVYRWEKGATPLKRVTIQRLEEVTGIVVPRRAEAPDLTARVVALEGAVSGLVEALRAGGDEAQRRLLLDAVAEAMGLIERPGQAKRPRRPRKAKGPDE